MSENIDRIVCIVFSLILLSIGFSIVFVGTHKTKSILSVYEGLDGKGEILTDYIDRVNIISREEAEAIVGDILLLTYRDRVSSQVLYLNGKQIDLTPDMEIPKLYLGDSSEAFDFQHNLPVLDKMSYTLTYEYTDDLEISAYRLR